MKKELECKFDKEAYEEYLKLQDEQLKKAIDATIDKLKQNPFLGEYIPKKQVPKETKEFYGTNKLFRVKLTKDWRLIYTIIGDEVKIIAFILEFMNHKKYERRFKY